MVSLSKLNRVSSVHFSSVTLLRTRLNNLLHDSSVKRS